MIAAALLTSSQDSPEHPGGDDAPIELIAVLRDLVSALDRRIPQMGRAGEEEIARDSGALRTKALERIAQLTND
jgi:hypothetical protein